LGCGEELVHAECAGQVGVCLVVGGDENE